MAEAQRVAYEALGLLGPACARIEVAGSVRRRRESVKDVEIVCVGRTAPAAVDLFGEMVGERNLLDERCDELLAQGVFAKRVGEKGGTAWGHGVRRAVFGGVGLDVFGTTAEQFGLIFLIRTGDAEFSRSLVTPRYQGGLLPMGMRVQGGWLWDGGRRLVTREEEDVFAAIGVPWIEPWERNAERVRAIRREWEDTRMAVRAIG